MKKIIILACCFLLPFYGMAEVKATANGIDADFKEITLEDALIEIAAVSNIEIKVTGDLSEKITVGYRDIPVEKVLNALLDDYNAMYFRDELTDKIERVRIFSGKGVVLAAPPSEEKDEKASLIPPEQLAEFRDGAFYMKVKINGATLEYLVDTGASMLTIRKRDAYLMSLPVGEEIEITTANGKIKGNITTVDNFEMAGLQLKGVDAVIIDEQNLSVGLIGQNILRHYQVIQHKDMMRIIPSGAVQEAGGQSEKSDNKEQPADNKSPALEIEPAGETPDSSVDVEGAASQQEVNPTGGKVEEGSKDNDNGNSGVTQ